MDERRDLSLNERAAKIADRMAAESSLLRVGVSILEGGTRIVDCGIDAPGGLEAGRYLAEACMGGAGHVAFTTLNFDGWQLPGVSVWTDLPAIACLGCQYAGWAIQHETFFAMGSGPLRAIARVERELFGRLAYSEGSDQRSVLVLETRTLPDAHVAAYVAEKASVQPSELSLLVAPTASFAAGVQIAARVVETALHKMLELGFDVGKILTGFGAAPLAPIARSDSRAIGRTNDCILYGGAAHLSVRADDAELEALVPRIPSSASKDYGTPFYELFKRYGGDFYKVDPLLFSPAKIALTNVATGRTFEAGAFNPGVLRQSLLS